MSEEEANNNTDDSSRNLSIMAAAVEHMSSSGAAADQHSPSRALSPTRRIKLVLPNLTPAMQQDLALTKTATTKASKPLSIGTRPEYADYVLQGIVTPHPNDVLCGRGGGSNNHPGNESFRELVNEVKFPYVNCPKREKPLIARRIVEAVRNQTPPGRFLSKDSKTGLWNDIGDGKAREKTSQALREGAPIIRDMIGKPTSPTNVAAVLKEAKKMERAEKEYGVKLPKRSPDKNEDLDDATANNAQAPHHASAQASPSLPKNEPTVMKRGVSMGGSPPSFGPGPMPPIKKFRSFGEQDNGQQPPTAWPPIPHQHQQPGRNFNMMPYAQHAHHHGQLMGGFAPPPQRPVDYANNGGMPRYPNDVPMETVRRLLLGQLDPVQLAMQLLPPEEAAVVARRHAPPGGLTHLGRMSRGPPLPPPGPSNNNVNTLHSGPSPAVAVTSHPLPLNPMVSNGSSMSAVTSHPLPLNPMVSDGSSMSSSGDSTQITTMRRAPSDQSNQSSSAAQGGGDDASSVGSSNQSSNGARALPRKKRKYVEATV